MPALFSIGSSFSDSIYKSITAGSTIPADITARPLLAITMFAGMTAGFSSFLTGLVAVVRQKEKAILLFISTVIGGLFYAVSDWRTYIPPLRSPYISLAAAFGDNVKVHLPPVGVWWWFYQYLIGLKLDVPAAAGFPYITSSEL